MAGLYLHGKGVEKNPQTAYVYYNASAEKGNAYAVYELAKMERDGIGTNINKQLSDEHFQRAYQWFTELLDKRCDDNLLYRVGQMAYTGTGTERNESYGLSLLEKACELGNVHAKNMLTNIYLKDKDIEGIKRIIPLLTESAEKGVDTAQFALAKCFLLEEESVCNLPQAIKWLTLSAEQGNQFAQYSLGRLYLDGREDFSPDTRQAERWLTLSAEQGNQFAQYSLGKLYYYGRGIVAPDPGKAYLWLSRSAEQGNSFAKALLEKEAYQYQAVKRKVTHNIGYLISKLSRYLNNEQEKRRSIMLYEQMEQQLQAELEQ